MGTKPTTSYYSQFGEDAILAQLFEKKEGGTCVEVGAHDGVEFSNSYYFEQRGWKCILVEPNPYLCERLRRNRTGLLFECAASSAEGRSILHLGEGADVLSTLESTPQCLDRITTEGGSIVDVPVQTRTLDSILREAQVSHVDFITIDVEGHELEVLRGFSVEGWRPRIAIIEDNSGLHDETVETFMRAHGYVRFYRTAINDWYGDRRDRTLTGISRLLRSSVFADKKAIVKLRCPRRVRPQARAVWRLFRYGHL